MRCEIWMAGVLAGLPAVLGAAGCGTRNDGTAAGGSATAGGAAGAAPLGGFGGGGPTTGGGTAAGSGGSSAGSGGIQTGGTGASNGGASTTDGGAGAAESGGTAGGGSTGIGGAATYRAGSIPIGIENVNDSPLKQASYRVLLRFVPDDTITIDRFYFGYKLRGADCWDAGNAGYGSGDGGLLEGTLVDIDPVSGLPAGSIAAETVNGCTRYDEAQAEAGSTPVLVWVNTPATLEGGTLYGLVVRNAHADPPNNFFSFNAPLAGTELAGPHTRNELRSDAGGAILSLDPREHVAWSDDAGGSWQYGSDNGQYNSYLNDRDTDHPATRMPQYGFRLSDGTTLGPQPYYAYSIECTGCTAEYANARYARTFTELGGFTASDGDVGTLTIVNTSTGAESSCAPSPGFGFRTCTLPDPVSVAPGQSYTVSATGTVETMEMDASQRTLFPGVGTPDGELRIFQPNPAPGTNAKDVPSLWAGPLSAHFPAPDDR